MLRSFENLLCCSRLDNVRCGYRLSWRRPRYAVDKIHLSRGYHLLTNHDSTIQVTTTKQLPGAVYVTFMFKLIVLEEGGPVQVFPE